MTIEVGHILDRYELLEKVGQGGMAVVYRAVDRSLQRTVAVKILHGHLAGDREARSRFEREARVVARLRHPNIVEIYDFSGADSEDSYIVTEYIEGQTLERFLVDHPIRFPELAALLTIQVCHALTHAHELGVLHRDVKPENIMIRDDGVIKLMDFGIAHMVNTEKLTATGQLLGSPAYMSPEHLEGKPLDFRTDVFAIGILLYQTATGRLPFFGRNPHEVLKRIADGVFPDPCQVNPHVGKQLHTILVTALARDQNDRYASIRDMLAALERYADSSGLPDHKAELQQFFAAPSRYQLALRPRLINFLFQRGQQNASTKGATAKIDALETFNRILTLDPENEEVIAALKTLSSNKHRWLFAAMATVAILLLGWQLWPNQAKPTRISQIAAVANQDASLPVGATSPQPVESDSSIDNGAPSVHEDSTAQPSRKDVLPASAGNPIVNKPKTPDAVGGKTGTRQKSPPSKTEFRKTLRSRVPIPRPPVKNTPTGPRMIRLQVYPRNAEYRIDGGSWKQIKGRTAKISVTPSTKRVQLRHASCQSETRTIDANTQVVAATLAWLPAHITPTCATAGTRVQINKRTARLGQANPIPISSTVGEASVNIVFFSDDGQHMKRHTRRIRANEHREVPCNF